MNMKNMKNMLPIILSLFVMVGCSSTKSANNTTDINQLFGKQWKLIEVDNQIVPENSKAGFMLTEDNKVSGNTGCNIINGQFEKMKTQSIKFSQMATTRMACPDDINLVETKFLAAINSSTSWKIENDVLSLMSGNTIVAKLKAPEKSTGLNGNWELSYITGPRITFEGLYPQKKPTIIFNMADSSASGNSSCNSYSVPVEVKGNKISFGEGLATLMACEGDGETVYFQTLRSVKSYKMSSDNNTLELIKDGVPVMRFTRK